MTSLFSIIVLTSILLSLIAAQRINITRPPPLLPDGTIVSPQYVGCISEQRFFEILNNDNDVEFGVTTIQSNKEGCNKFCLRASNNYSDAYYRQKSHQCRCAGYKSNTPTADLVDALDSYGNCKKPDASDYDLYSFHVFDRCYASVPGTPAESFIALYDYQCSEGCWYNSHFNVSVVDPFQPQFGQLQVNCNCYSDCVKGVQPATCGPSALFRYERRLVQGGICDESCGVHGHRPCPSQRKQKV